MKNFHDGTQINISTHSQWVDDYYALNLNRSSYYEGNPLTYRTGLSCWSETLDLPVLVHGRDYFNSQQGVTYSHQTTDGCEFFFFSSPEKDREIIEFYMNNLDLLKKFTFIFVKKAGNL